MQLVQEKGLWYLRSEKLHAFGIKHGFTTKKVGEGENPLFHQKPFDIIESELFSFAEKLGLENHRFVFQEQVHGDNITIIDENLLSQRIVIIPQNDGLISSATNVCLVSLSADCLSIILAHPDKKAIATAHAGRKGAISGLPSKLLWHFCMEYQIPPSEVLVALGTSISARCYEVGNDVVEELKNNAPQGLGFLFVRNEKRFFDLRGFIFHSLTSMGVNPDNIDSQSICSHCRDDLFYSYRRDGKVLGSMAAFIAT